MMCEQCGERPATVMVTRIDNGKKSEQHLCHVCAQSSGEYGLLAEPGFTFQNILAGLFDPGGLMSSSQVQVRPKVRCENCGLTFTDFRRLGQLGCSECYKTFGDQLDPIVRRIHGSLKHSGKTIDSNGAVRLKSELEALKKQLREAIEAEAYEKAAELRDAIREVEGKLSQE